MFVCPSQKMPAYYKICHFTVNYGFVMFYSTGPWSSIGRQGRERVPEGLNQGQFMPYSQILDLAGKACQGQTLWLN
jgi:hypothetical protein